MKLKAKKVGLATGSAAVAVLNYKDAQHAGLKQGDRILLAVGRKKAVGVVNIVDSSHIVRKGHIGFSNELHAALEVRSGQVVSIDISQKPQSVYYIAKKLRGAELTKQEIYAIVQDVVDNTLTDIEITYFVSACYIHELSDREIADFTRAMVSSGKQLKFSSAKVVADKHCIGGVAGNRTTCLVVPIIAAAGITIPKTSSRSITSPAGTADTMEVLCDVTLTLDAMKKVVSKTGACMVWGGAMDLAPADDRLIRIEHPLSLDPIGQMIASILAKKLSAGSTHCLIDIPVGKGAKVHSRSHGTLLQKKFEKLGRMLGLKTKVVITDGTEPIGNGIGPALEARDLLWTLKNDSRGSAQLRQKAIRLADELLALVGSKQSAKELLDSGAAYKKFVEILRAQGARVTNPDVIAVGKHIFEIRATRKGVVSAIDNSLISRIAIRAGAPFDTGAGIYLHKHVGDRVAAGDLVYVIYGENKQKAKGAYEYASAQSGISYRR